MWQFKGAWPRLLSIQEGTKSGIMLQRLRGSWDLRCVHTSWTPRRFAYKCLRNLFLHSISFLHGVKDENQFLCTSLHIKSDVAFAFVLAPCEQTFIIHENSFQRKDDPNNTQLILIINPYLCFEFMPLPAFSALKLFWLITRAGDRPLFLIWLYSSYFGK